MVVCPSEIPFVMMVVCPSYIPFILMALSPSDILRKMNNLIISRVKVDKDFTYH